ncbi:SusC/RagA family TonB-linked outer membrane protein [Arachidicoccus soli]|uniref:SusC/RagA family TonB-linked outer membrane protein n=1 Tax=Arachidicoccus soli TaxID=2341117 RepID=A0A386HNL0_9BACT|nr:SusC/RagA family TonB-linked outer membrane protein [Arachidicoccus soli]AYD47343.1 SusC/RagA family TonB-linked outer membrane protein [Arachidicoccus soli]
MKIGILCLVSVMLSFQLWGQTVTIKENNISLHNLFKEIRSQTGYEFLYNSEMIEKISPLNVNVRNETISKVLDGCFKNLPLSYKIIDDKTIIVRQKKLISNTDSVVAPVKKIVQGRIVDDKDNEIAGASIIVKGSKRGAISDNDGHFTLDVANINADSLIINFVGFQQKVVAINLNKSLNVVIHPLINEIAEVMVSTGYQEINSDSYTGTAVTVSGANLKKVNPQSILQSLQVFDPSFKIVENNLAGSNPNSLPNINVRGSTALPSGSSTDIISRNNLAGTVNLPTFILDGFEVSVQNIYDLDINRVKSVTLLKDAAATAVYGSRAANGVVVITTNPPKEGKLQLSYNYELNVTTPDLSQYHVLNASQKLDYENLAGLYTMNNNPGLSQDQLDALYYHKKELVLSGVNTDWLSQPVRTAYGQKHSLYLEGGTQSFRYGLAMRYQTAPGVMKGSSRNRYSTDIDLSYYLGKKLIFKNAVTITKTDSRESPYGSFSNYVRMNPYYPKMDSLGKIDQVLDSWTEHDSRGSVYSTPVLNPLYDASLGSFNKSEYLQIIDAFTADWHISNALRLKGLISVNQIRTTGNNFVSPFANQFYFYSTADIAKRGSYDYNTNTETTVDGNVTLNYNKQVNKNNINFLVGANMHSDLSNYLAISAIGFSNDRFSDIGYANSYATGTTPYSDVEKSRLVGAFTTLNYSYADKYLLDFTFREDGSSNFGSNNRIAPFSSLGLGWNMHKEDFMQGSIFSRFKLRASAGYTGSVSFSPYMAQTTYNYYMSNAYITGIGAYVNNYGNNNLEWQKTRDIDFGLEIGFLQDRLLIKPRYYSKLTQGLIGDVTLPPSTGFSTYKDNIGNMRNNGWELSFQYNVVKSKDFSLDLTTNLVHNQNIIVKISDALKAYNKTVDDAQTNAGNQGVPLLHYVEGQSLNTIYAVKSLGIDPESGREIYVKRDGTLTYDWSADDIVPVGNTEPGVSGFFGSSIRYKQFNLTFNFYTQWGGEIYNQTLVDRVENADPRYNVDSRVFDQKWRQSGDLAFYKNIADLGQTQVSSRFVEPDNVLQLQSLYLSYDTQKSFYKKFGMQNLRFAFTMNDVFRWSSVKEERGIDYPFARSFTFALTANF